MRRCDERTDETFIREPKYGFFDIFEPTYIEVALQKPADISLAHLVFGEAWAELTDSSSCPFPPDPLTKVFHELGMLTVLPLAVTNDF